jgi:hypothetical protein
MLIAVADSDSDALSSLTGRNGVEFADFEVSEPPAAEAEAGAVCCASTARGERPPLSTVRSCS